MRMKTSSALKLSGNRSSASANSSNRFRSKRAMPCSIEHVTSPPIFNRPDLTNHCSRSAFSPFFIVGARVSCYKIDMKFATACILSCVAFATIAAGAPRKIAFGREGQIWVASIDGTAAKKLVSGDSPVFSPDGTRIAFVFYPPSADGDDPDSKTQIAVVDVVSGEVTILKDIPSEKCLNPAWSPDGKWIAFQSFRGDRFTRISDLAVVKEDGTGFNVIKKGRRHSNRSSIAHVGRVMVVRFSIMI